MRAVVVTALCGVLILGCGSGSTTSPATSSPAPSVAQATTSAAPPSATPAATPTIRPTPTPLGPPAQSIEAAGATKLRQGGDWMHIAGGSAWIAGDSGVQQLDGQTGAPKALVPATAVCTAMDVGFDRLWLTDCAAGAVIAVDPKTAASTSYSLNGSVSAEEGSIAAGEGAIWVATTAKTLVRLDPTTRATTAFPLPEYGAGVRAGLGSVWVTLPEAGQVLRIDPDDGSIKATIPAGREPRFLTIGGDSVWVQNNGDGTVTRIDATGAVVATIPVSMSGIEGGDIAYGGGFVWPRISAALVAKLDGKTGELLATYGPASGSGSVAADDQAAWVSAHDVFAVWRLPLD